MNRNRLAQRIWMVILFGYFVAILVLAITGTLSRFVQSRWVPAVVVSAGVFAIAAAGRWFVSSQDYAPPSSGFVVFLIPVVFVVLGLRYSGPPASAFLGPDSSVAAGLDSAFATGGRPPSALPFISRSGQDTGLIPREVSGLPSDPSIVEIERIEFAEELFFRYYSLLYDQPELFAGKTVVIRGFAGREPAFKADRFYVGRHLLWCCTSDASLLPVVVEADRTAIPRKGVWVEIEATVGSTRFVGSAQETTIPLLHAQSIREIDAPEFTYVFAF